MKSRIFLGFSGIWLNFPGFPGSRIEIWFIKSGIGIWFLKSGILAWTFFWKSWIRDWHFGLSNPASQLFLWCANSILGRKMTTRHNFSLISRGGFGMGFFWDPKSHIPNSFLNLTPWHAKMSIFGHFLKNFELSSVALLCLIRFWVDKPILTNHRPAFGEFEVKKF